MKCDSCWKPMGYLLLRISQGRGIYPTEYPAETQDRAGGICRGGRKAPAAGV